MTTTRTALLDHLAEEVTAALLAYSESLWAEADQHRARAIVLRIEAGLPYPDRWWLPACDRLPSRQEVEA